MIVEDSMKELIGESMLLGIISCLLGILYNYSLQNNSVFGKFGSLLSRLSEKKGFLGWLSDPLGACIYCSTTWLTIIIMVIYWSSWECLPSWQDIVICTISAIGVQHILMRLWCEITEITNV